MVPDGIISSAVYLIVTILVPVSYIRGVVECLPMFVCISHLYYKLVSPYDSVGTYIATTSPTYLGGNTLS